MKLLSNTSMGDTVRSKLWSLFLSLAYRMRLIVITRLTISYGFTRSILKGPLLKKAAFCDGGS